MPAITKRVIRDLEQKQDYLRRWSLWLPFGWSIKLHQILRADDDRCSHDHPWSFLRIILWGGYTEEFRHERPSDTGYGVHVSSGTQTLKSWRPWAPWRVYLCSGSFRHRITALSGKSSWTLVVCGPKVREWGFFTNSGFMPWKSFVAAAWSKRILWCDDGREIELADPPQREVHDA